MNPTVAIVAKSKKINSLVLDALNSFPKILIVVDSPIKKSSTDGNITYFFRPLDGDFASQRNFALEKAKSEWVLFIDDDEYVSRELVREIKELSPNNKINGYFLKRIDVCFHDPLLHGETGNTKLLRLARKAKGKFSRPVHEKWIIKGETGTLRSPLYHIKDGFVSDFIGRMSFYSDADAKILAKEGKPFSFWRLFLNPVAKFTQNYFLRRGFQDGIAGLFQAYLMSVQSLTVRVFQWTKRN